MLAGVGEFVSAGEGVGPMEPGLLIVLDAHVWYRPCGVSRTCGSAEFICWHVFATRAPKTLVHVICLYQVFHEVGIVAVPLVMCSVDAHGICDQV